MKIQRLLLVATLAAGLFSFQLGVDSVQRPGGVDGTVPLKVLGLEALRLDALRSRKAFADETATDSTDAPRRQVTLAYTINNYGYTATCG